MTEGFFKWLARNIREAGKEINDLKHDLAARGMLELISGIVLFVVIIMFSSWRLMDPMLRLAFYLLIGVECVLLSLHGMYLIAREWS